MNDLVCVDTQVLIWGIKQESNSGQEQRIDDTLAFLKKLDEDGDKVLVPSVALGEMLVNASEERRGELNAYVVEVFRIVDYDAQAALIFARLYQKYLNDRRSVESNQRPSHLQNRHKMKADLMIIATALAHQADIICSDDDGVRKLAQAHLRVMGIPPAPPEQKRLDLQG